MHASRPAPVLFTCLLFACGLLLALFGPMAYASGQPAALTSENTTLDVAIHSSPQAVRDNNDLSYGPRLFVVHAVVTNTGAVAAEQLVVTLDYQISPANGWTLATGEDAIRTVGSLAAGEARHFYWFASYPAQNGSGHQYEVSAEATNAAPVSTTDNVHGNPQPGITVLTTSYQDTGNNGQIALTSDIVVGTTFSMTVVYDLSQNAYGLIFSPAGNLDIDFGFAELRGVSIRFYDAGDTQETVVEDQLYFPAPPLLPNSSAPRFAEATYTFLTQGPGSNILCPYTGIDYGTTRKYDNDYCDTGTSATVVADVSFEMSKAVSDLQIQEGEQLTYTVYYTNTGAVPLQYAWIWDEIDPQLGRIISATISPAPDPDVSHDHLTAWSLGTIPPSGQQGSSGSVTYSVLVDGAAADIADGQPFSNSAFLGINEGSLPSSAALTQTVTSTVNAPALVLEKTDGLATVQDGRSLVYTVTVRNEGSVAATNLSASDLLPDQVTLSGAPSPAPSSQVGQTLAWDNLGDLAPGETLTLTIPATVTSGTSSFTTLTNTFSLDYENPAGHVYQTAQVSDSTTVMRAAAFVEGMVYEDANGNGLLDPGESGLSGVQLSLPGAYTPTVSSDASGFYRFRIEAEGLYTLTETDSTGYLSTTPNRVALDVELGQTYTVNFGDALAGGSGVVSIYGTVFHDSDGDAVWDLDEPGIAGVTVTLDGGQSVTTDAYGSYSFGAVTPGLHMVVETDPAGHISTTPNTVAVSAAAESGYEVNFGDVAQDSSGGSDVAVIYGTVFADEDGDGQWDDDEAGLPGVTVTMNDSTAVTTDAYGSYSFGTVAPGIYTVEETDPAGYLSTTPNRVTFDAAVGEVHEVNFGDALAQDSGTWATIYGTVFTDNDGDGVWDAHETGIPAVTVTLDGTQMATTDQYGSYSFGSVPSGEHTVTETDLPAYTSTTPNDVTVAAAAGNSYAVDFGDVLLGTGSCAADPYEDDDSHEQAQPLQPGVVAEHDFCDEDTADWHSITLERGDVYTITTASRGQRADTVLALFDRDGQTQLAGNDDYAGTDDFSSQIVWEAEASGTYYMRITNRAGLDEWLTGYDVWAERQDNNFLLLPLIDNGPPASLPATSDQDGRGPSLPATGDQDGRGPSLPATGDQDGRAPYTRMAKPGPASPDGVINHCAPDDYEVDDSWEQARAIVPGAPQTHTFDSDTAQYAADKDFVALAIGLDGSLAASATGTTDVLLELFDAQGQVLGRSGVNQLQWSDPPVGRYYLSATPVVSAHSCDGSVGYELTVDYTPLYQVLLPAIVKP